MNSAQDQADSLLERSVHKRVSQEREARPPGSGGRSQRPWEGRAWE